MAETALSIAGSVLGSAISKAAAAAADKMSLLMGVQNEIWFMKDELKTMQAFLIAAETLKKKKPLLKVWAEQVRSLSYDIEDCLDEFMVHVGTQSLKHQLMKLKHRHRIAVQIQNLKSRVEEVSSRNTRYNLIQMEDTEIGDAQSYKEGVRNQSGTNIDEAELVGTSAFKTQLLDMINAQYDDSHARVICVIGMGGLGKTTLVRKIYKSKEGIEDKFPYRAWITVSQSFSRIDMLKLMIRQLLGDGSLKSCLEKLDGKAHMLVQAEHLGTYLVEELKDKRYFVVLDDLWSIDAWFWIRDRCFPSMNNKASRIVITTRDASVAEDCTTTSNTKPIILVLRPLEKKHSIDLLLRKMMKTEQDMENDEKLKIVVTNLVTKCGGLPLAIVTIGAMFATKPESEWDMLYRQLPVELENNLSLEAIKNMVSLSYNHLPSHLKPCFLYLSIFPEDFEIKRKRLVNRWIAEGLVRARAGMTLEDAGEKVFKDLISRSMIQSSRVNLEGTVKSCRVHDIMRDIIVSLSREEGFVYTSGNNAPGTPEDTFRHVTYNGSENLSMVGMDWSRVRSLSVFSEGSAENAFPVCSTQLRMLRTLDLENTDVPGTQKDISNIGLLRHLKYVNIGSDCGSTYSLPRFIGKLQGLQTLVVSNSYISTLPAEICTLRSLRTIDLQLGGYYYYFEPDEAMKCLKQLLGLPMMFTPLCDSEDRNNMIAELHKAYSSCWSGRLGVKVPRGIGNLKELQILRIVNIKRTSRRSIEELGELSKLRKLRVDTEGAIDKKCTTLCKAIEKLSSLSSLFINGGNGTIEWVDSVFSPPPLLRSLRLGGYIGDKFDWLRNLTQLVKLRLWQSELEEPKAMEILGALPNLMLLNLSFYAYAGKQLVFKQDTFQNLMKLFIWNARHLKEIRFEHDAAPHMELISMGSCELEIGINGIKHLSNLKEIDLSCGGKVARLGMLQDEVNTHDSKPVLRLSEDQSYHDLGDPEGSDEYFEAMESLPGDDEGDNSEAITVPASDRSVCSVSPWVTTK